MRTIERTNSLARPLGAPQRRTDNAMVRHIKLRPTDLCPCRCGWMITSCCLDASDGKLRKKFKTIKPPSPTTNYSHPNCYLRITNDCSQDISREHYISANVLEQLGDEGIQVSGLPWFKPEELKRLSVDNLTSKILCTRHNENLSPLDSEAGTFFRFLTAALVTLQTKKASKNSDFYLVSGEALELWLLKTACGLFFSSAAAAGGERLAKTHSIDMEKVQRALFEGIWDDCAGLYYNGRTGSVVTVSGGLKVAPLSKDNVFAGLRIGLHAFELELIFDTSLANPGEWGAITRRPSELVLERGERDQRLILTWPKGVPEKSVIFTDTTPV
jgi:hypothetical protein